MASLEISNGILWQAAGFRETARDTLQHPAMVHGPTGARTKARALSFIGSQQVRRHGKGECRDACGDYKALMAVARQADITF